MAKRALHDINGLIITVNNLSRSESNVRAAIMAGTLQPKPTIIGTKDLPGNPRARIALSTTKAALAIYPDVSNNDKKKNIAAMTGINVSVVLIPLPTPLANKAINQFGAWICSNSQALPVQIEYLY